MQSEIEDQESYQENHPVIEKASIKGCLRSLSPLGEECDKFLTPY